MGPEERGTVRGGPCGRLACQKTPATWWNASTQRWYCGRCAAAINRHNPGLLTEAPDGEDEGCRSTR